MKLQVRQPLYRYFSFAILVILVTSDFVLSRKITTKSEIERSQAQANVYCVDGPPEVNCALYTDAKSCSEKGCKFLKNGCCTGANPQCGNQYQAKSCADLGCTWSCATCCSGSSPSCPSNTNATSCSSAGCTWNCSSCCTGSNSSCASQTTASSCSGTQGCSWNCSSCCTGSSPTCTNNTNAASCSSAGCTWNCANSDGFVRREGTKLILNGKTYKFIGFNRDNAATDNRGNGTCGDGGDKPDIYLEKMFDDLRNKCGGASNENLAVRVWAFQKFTTYNAATDTVDFSQIDRVIEKAKRYGIKLIMTLENNYLACTIDVNDYRCKEDSAPGRKKHTWYWDDIQQNQPGISGKGFKTWKAGVSPNWGYNYPLTYKDYVGRIVTRYKNEPAILMWELMNEIDPEAVVSSKPGEIVDGVGEPACQKINYFDGIYNFAYEMSQYVKEKDPNHLVALGVIGNYRWLENNSYGYNRIFGIPYIDIADSHVYSLVNPNSETLHGPAVDANLSSANSLNKVHFIGESGIKKPSVYSENDAQRVWNLERLMVGDPASWFSGKGYFLKGGDGYSIWSFSEGYLDPYHSSSIFDIYPNEPSCSVLSQSKFKSSETCKLDGSCTTTDLSQPNIYQFIPSSNGADYRGKTIQEICQSKGAGWNCSPNCKIYSTFDAAYHCSNCIPNQTISDTDCSYRIPSTATYLTGCCTLSSTLGTPTPIPTRAVTPTTVPTPTRTATPTPSPIPGTGPLMKYTWNSSLQGWTINSSLVTGLTYTTSRAKQGAGSMRAVVGLTGSASEEGRLQGPALSPLQNWAVQGRNLSVYIFIPSSALRNKLTASMFVKRNSTADLYRSSSITLVPGSWVKLTWQNAPLSSVYVVGLSVFSTESYTGNVFFDSLAIE